MVDFGQKNFIQQSIIRYMKIGSERKSGTNGSKADFWTFKGTVGKMGIVVIVRAIDDGRKHFLSVMNKRHK